MSKARTESQALYISHQHWQFPCHGFDVFPTSSVRATTPCWRKREFSSMDRDCEVPLMLRACPLFIYNEDIALGVPRSIRIVRLEIVFIAAFETTSLKFITASTSLWSAKQSFGQDLELKEVWGCEVPSLHFLFNVAKWQTWSWKLLALAWMTCLPQTDSNTKVLTIPLIIVCGLTDMGASHLAYSLPKEICDAGLSANELITVWISVAELYSACGSAHYLHTERQKTLLPPLQSLATRLAIGENINAVLNCQLVFPTHLRTHTAVQTSSGRRWMNVQIKTIR